MDLFSQDFFKSDSCRFQLMHYLQMQLMYYSHIIRCMLRTLLFFKSMIPYYSGARSDHIIARNDELMLKMNIEIYIQL